MSAPLLPTSPAVTGLKVLVVDDQVEHARALSALLTDMGCRAYTACDGRTALQLFHHTRPHAVFLDLDMPGLDGCDAAMLLQAEDAEARTLLVCLTGHHEPAHRERCLRAGFDLFCTKPVNDVTLHQALQLAQQRRDEIDGPPTSAAPLF